MESMTYLYLCTKAVGSSETRALMHSTESVHARPTSGAGKLHSGIK